MNHNIPSVADQIVIITTNMWFNMYYEQNPPTKELYNFCETLVRLRFI